MKTYLLRLEAFDDIISVRDKMGWAKAQRILLVWPEDARILSRRLDLLMLQRRSQQLGAQLGLVCEDLEIQVTAAELKIPVFGTLEAAQRQPWRRGRRQKNQNSATPEPKFNRDELLKISEERPAKTDSRRWFDWAGFILGICAILALVTFFLPSVKIVLTPEMKTQSVEVALRVSPDFKQTSVSGQIKAEVVSVVVEGRGEIPVSGRASVTTSPATGVVEFRNLTTGVVKIPAGTTVLTTGAERQHFKTLSAVSLPAGVGEIADATVQAEENGVKGNVDAGAIQAVEGNIGLLVAVNNPLALSGGRDETVRGVSEIDISKLRDQIMEGLLESANQELQNSLATDETLVPDTVLVQEIVLENANPAVGMPGDTVNMTLQVKFKAWKVRISDLEAVGGPVLDADRPPDYEVREGTLTFSTKTPVKISGNEADWKLIFSRQIQAPISKTDAVAAAAGKTPTDAIVALEKRFELADDPEILLFPTWWPVLPSFPARIEIGVQ